MILKIVSLFLIGMIVLAMFGKLRVPKLGYKTAKRCTKCGTYRIGKSPLLLEVKKIKSFDVDWPEDFKIAENIYNSLYKKKSIKNKN